MKIPGTSRVRAKLPGAPTFLDLSPKGPRYYHLSTPPVVRGVRPLEPPARFYAAKSSRDLHVRRGETAFEEPSSCPACGVSLTAV